MRTKDKQNKHKLKFDYIAQLQILGKIWKEHSSLVNPSIYHNKDTYNHAVIKLMSKSKKKEYSSFSIAHSPYLPLCSILLTSNFVVVISFNIYIIHSV